MVPKNHSWIHMSFASRFGGNPAFSSTYEDESENGVVAAIGAKAHPHTFAKSVFQRLELLHV